ncbi:hypothetical protein [Rubrivirga sp.]|uniref:hypothetical protein n=1 Tax=Rubrivirga sp. TaxID=1885344 RepID=UPI003C78DD6C
MLRLSLLAAVLVALVATPSRAQIVLSDDLRLDIAGGVQPRASVGIEENATDETRYGFGLRRARIQARVLYRDLGGVEYDVEGGSGSIESVDLFAFANLTNDVQARVGYFPVAQPAGGILTPYFLIDAVDRAAIDERWLSGTLGGDGRDLGADVTYRSGRTTASVAVHNGFGTFQRGTNNFREGISAPDVVNGIETPGLAISSVLVYEPGDGLEVGVYGGFNGANPDRTDRGDGGRDYTSAGAHVYWGASPGSQPLRVKLDALVLSYADDGRGGQDQAGVSAFGAARVLGSGEVFGRVERYWDDADLEGDDFVTAGLSYSPSAARGAPYERARLTLAYHYRTSDVLEDAHLVVLQGQLAF